VTTSHVQVVPLRDRPDAMEQLARWHYAEWGHWNPSNNVERRIERFREHLLPDRIPQTFIAVEGETLLGSASLVSADLATHGHLSPWLASVYVDSSYRNRGVGSALVERVVAEARRLGLPRLFLFTPDRVSFYARMGWQPVEQSNWGATPVTIMQLELLRG
jgi:N-acetylglutamate synthase-like GNAT family acetyltransferase